MSIKTGDLVYKKQQRRSNTPQDHEIWLVLGVEPREKGQFKGFIRVQNVYSGYICQYNEGMLIKIETDKK